MTSAVAHRPAARVPARTILLAAALLSAVHSRAAEPVTLSEDEQSFTLDNGLVRAVASKRSGDLLSLKYQGLEMLNVQSGRQAGYWSHNVERGRRSSAVTIDPKANQGERGEVSIRGTYTGVMLGSGPGGGAVADIEIRYTVERGTPGVYTCSVVDHKTNYPATSVGEARFCAKLNDDLFDWMTVDANRNLKMLTAYDWNHGTVLNMKEARRLNSGIYQGKVEHKYDYTANQFEVRAWGWSSSAKGLGVWFINPSVEYLSCGPTKFELCAHRDATFGTNLNAPAPPTLLNYWRSSHYGGSVCAVSAGEPWKKVIGPFLIYCNAGQGRDGLWKDALQKASAESGKWPYDWVSGVDYPHRAERGTVRGRLVLEDSGGPGVRMSRLLVGLSAPKAESPAGRRGFPPRAMDWQNDAKHYQFWVRGDAEGTFAIPNVRSGVYTLHAFADGVHGEFTWTNITVAPGRTVELGSLTWQPVRHGKQLWEIGIPNRSAAEFFRGDDYFHWGWYLEYAKLFPRDVTYVVGRSDFRRDWFFEQVPHNEDPANTDVRRPGRGTTWSIVFELPSVPKGIATLRLAICGVGTRSIAVEVNGKPAGTVSGLLNDSTIIRDGISGTWSEHDVAFDASLLKAGENTLKLTIPGGNLAAGIMYDYLRLELDEAADKSTRTSVGMIDQ